MAVVEAEESPDCAPALPARGLGSEEKKVVAWAWGPEGAEYGHGVNLRGCAHGRGGGGRGDRVALGIGKARGCAVTWRSTRLSVPLFPSGRRWGWWAEGPCLTWKPPLVTGEGCDLMRVPGAGCTVWAFGRVPETASVTGHLSVGKE